MKSLMILGSIIGFVIGTSFGLVAKSSWPTTLWRAGAAALVAFLLIRWWSRIWMNGLRDSLQQRRYARSTSPGVNKPATKL
ncbi:MAG TPA: hypothetical protein VK327_17200 [Candidatus Paceibacterota bacterium]|nr:hypothetical protein [Candidatus Paceibacterota bacterium]